MRSPLLLLVALTGCAAAPGAGHEVGPDSLTLDSARYEATFNAALEAARDHGLPAEFRDRRGGVIETSAEHAATVLEPWRYHGAAGAQLAESTIGNQRRRARFEFTPVESPLAETPARPELLSDRDLPTDLTRHDGSIALRVTVFVERRQRPDIRRSTWTRHKSSVTRVVPTGVEAEDAPQSYWQPVARDEAFERRLLAAVQARTLFGTPSGNP